MNIIKRIIKKLFVPLLNKTNYTIVRKNLYNSSTKCAPEQNNAIKGYINPRETINKASALNLNAAEYLKQELNWGSGNWVKEMEHINIFDRFKGKRVLEIGTGAGIFLDQAIKRLSPCYYESYEPSMEWAEYLANTYKVVSCPSDGKNLSSTQSDSIDLCFINGVFVYIPFYYTVVYWNEINRVLRAGGYVVFNVFTEECMDLQSIKKWTLTTDTDYLTLIPENTIKDFFNDNGFTLIHTFYSNFGPGISKYFVFQITSDA